MSSGNVCPLSFDLVAKAEAVALVEVNRCGSRRVVAMQGAVVWT